MNNYNIRMFLLLLSLRWFFFRWLCSRGYLVFYGGICQCKQIGAEERGRYVVYSIYAVKRQQARFSIQEAIREHQCIIAFN
jgi:hypothetical protein